MSREHIVIDPPDREWLGQIGLTSVSRVMKYRGRAVAAISGSSETFPVDIDAGPDAPRRIFVKRYAYKGWATRLKGVFRGTLFGTSRARFEYEFLGEMRERHIPAVRPIAYGERRRAGFVTACFLITEGEVDAESLDAYVGGRVEPRDTSPRRRRRFVEALARTVRRMHQAGVMHGGLYWRNILVADTRDDAWQFLFIDPDRRGRLYPAEVPRNGVVSDLADFASTSVAFSCRTDVVRFGRAYFGKSRLGDSEKRLLGDVITAAAKRVVREGHRVAVGHTIVWLTRRMQQAGRCQQVDTVSAFFDHLSQAGKQARLAVDPEREATIQFVFQEVGKAGESVTYALVNRGGRLAITPGPTTRADLTIRTDAETWLAIVNGRSDAFDLIRTGRLTLTGDTKLLPYLTRLIEV